MGMLVSMMPIKALLSESKKTEATKKINTSPFTGTGKAAAKAYCVPVMVQLSGGANSVSMVTVIRFPAFNWPTSKRGSFTDNPTSISGCKKDWGYTVTVVKRSEK